MEGGISEMSEEPSKPPDKVDFSKHVNSLWCIYMVSVLSAFNAEIFTFPLDLVKTRLQIQGEKLGKMGKAPYKGMTASAVEIVKEEGFFKLWRGLSACFVRHAIYSGTRIAIYRKLKETILRNTGSKEFTTGHSIVCGVISGGIAQYIASPADLLKVQMQMEGKRRLMGLPPRHAGMWDAFVKTYSSGGVVALWKGSVPNVGRAALVTVGDISGYDVSKKLILKHTLLEDTFITHVLASFCAGFTSAVLGTPADVIKTRVMNQPFDEQGRGLLYKGPLDCLRKTIADEGLGSLYKGFVPVWLRLGPWALVFWITYEQIMRGLGAKSWR